MVTPEHRRFRGKVIFVRLSEEEYNALEGAAGWTPMATWARRTLLKLVSEQTPSVERKRRAR